MRAVWLASIRILAAALFLAPLVGCEGPDEQRPYQVFNGVVKALDVETGELFVRPQFDPPPPWRAGRNVPCVTTKESEIYINDRFSGLEGIHVGDVIELVGYRGRDDRFVVSMVSIMRSQPDPVEPALTPPTTRPVSANP